MANRNFLFVNSSYEIAEEAASVTTSAGAGDAGKLATLDSAGKWDISLIPDAVFNDRDWKESVRAATTAALPAVTYANGTAGVGATLTADANGALAAQDGVTLVVSDRLLVKDQASGLQNGIYVVTQVGDGSNPFILTRATDSDTATEMDAGACVAIEEGTVNADKYAIMTSNNPITIGTSALVWTIQNTTNLSAGNGILISSGSISVRLVADGGLEFSSGEIQVKFADTSVTADLDGTNGLHAIAAEDLYLNGSNQGAKILGFDPAVESILVGDTVQEAIDELSVLVSSGAAVQLTAGAGGVDKGDLVYISANNTALPLSISTDNFGIGLAQETVAAAASFYVSPNDTVLTGVLSGATAGTRYYWDGSAITATAPSGAGSRVWMVGVAKNATDLYVNIMFVKRNAV